MVDNASIEYETLIGKKLISVEYDGLSYNDNGSMCFDYIKLIFEDEYLEINVDVDSDEICLSQAKKDSTRRQIESNIFPFGDIAHKNLGWSWNAKNYLGYNDVFIISFDGPVPEFVFFGMASKVQLYKICFKWDI